MEESVEPLRKTERKQYIIHHGIKTDRNRKRWKKYENQSTADCILFLLWQILKLSFKGFCRSRRKYITRLFVFLCFPFVCLLRAINTIKWRRLLDRRRMKTDGLHKTFYRISVFVLEIAKTSLRLLSAKERTRFRLANHNRQKLFWITETAVNRNTTVKEV